MSSPQISSCSKMCVSSYERGNFFLASIPNLNQKKYFFTFHFFFNIPIPIHNTQYTHMFVGMMINKSINNNIGDEESFLVDHFQEVRSNYKSNLTKVDNEFYLPLSYLSNKNELNEKMVCDLELVSSRDTNDPRGIYERIMAPKSVFAKHVVSSFAKHYATEKTFLEQTQEVLDQAVELDEDENASNRNVTQNDKMLVLWDDMKNDPEFNYTYSYIDWDMFEFLNENEMFLTFMTMYNLSAPLLSLLTPIFILIMPFFIILQKTLHFTVENYMDIMLKLLQQNELGAFLTSFHKGNTQDKLNLAMSAAFYLFSIYQNFMMCLKFYNNMKLIHEKIALLLSYLTETCDKMQRFVKAATQYSTYTMFCLTVSRHLKFLEEARDGLLKITPYMLTYKKILEMGYVLRSFYKFYNDKTLNSSMLFSFGFCGYYECLQGLKSRLQISSNMSKATFRSVVEDDAEGTKFEDCFYPGMVDEENVDSIVLNDLSTKSNILLTGPNASGKTTILKTLLLNILLSQQFGMGCFKKATIVPYDFFHCYLNIPDTSGRDSLFQSESRQCSEILKCIQTNKEKQEKAENVRHFCAFDELYSGTNPKEAELCGYAFLSYLSKMKSNVDFVLTTHYTHMCEKLKKHKDVQNMRMVVIKKESSAQKQEDDDIDVIEVDDDDSIPLQYTYKIEEGINELNGGLLILEQMNYPEEILNTVKMGVKETVYENDDE